MVMDTPKVKADPLKFKDNKKYSERLKEAQKRNSLYDSVIVASGTIEKKLLLLYLILTSWVDQWESCWRGYCHSL